MGPWRGSTTSNETAAAYANSEALAYYARALGVCEKLGPKALKESIAIGRKRSFIHQFIGKFEDSIEDLNRVIKAAAESQDVRAQGMALAYRAPLPAAARREMYP